MRCSLLNRRPSTKLTGPVQDGAFFKVLLGCGRALLLPSGDHPVTGQLPDGKRGS